MPKREKIQNILKFLKDVELLKSVTRHSWTSKGRRESVAEHCWRLAIMAMILEKEFPRIDIPKVIRMLLVHDLGEVYDGDIPAFQKRPKNGLKIEENSVKKLVNPLSKENQIKILNLCTEFNECKTNEAKLAIALDKLEVVIQHNEADLSTWLPEEYKFQFIYGKEYMDFHNFIKKFREIVDEETKKKISRKSKFS